MTGLYCHLLVKITLSSVTMLLAFVWLIQLSQGMKMVANEEKPDLSRVLKSHTSLSRVQYALRCKRQYGCTDIAATEGKEGVCYLQGSAAVKNTVD